VRETVSRTTRWWTAAAAAGILASAPAETRELTSPMTLDDALQYAMEHSGLVAAARAGTEALEAKLSQAEWVAWPHASFKALLAPMARQYGNAVSGGTDLSEWGVFAYTEVTGTWPLYTFGKISSLKEAARHGVDVGRAREEIARAEATYRVRRGFHALAFAQELAEVIREGREYLDKARRHLDELEASDDPSFDPVDRMKMRVYDAQVLSKELQARRAAELARASLRVAIGLDPSDPVEFVVATPKPVEVAREVDAGVLCERALDRRAELKALREGVRAREADVRARRAAFWPDVFLAGQFRYGFSNVAEPQSSPFASDPFNTYTAGGGLGIQMDFEIGKKIGELREAEADLARLRAEARDAEAAVRLEVQKLAREMQDAKQMVAAQQTAVEAARGWVIAKTDLYDNDLCDLNDVMTALVQFFQARMDSLQAIYDYNAAVAALERAVGMDLLDASAPAAAE